MTNYKASRPPESNLVSAFGFNKQAVDIADSYALSWCRRTVQMVIAAMELRHLSFTKRMGSLLAPFRRAAGFSSRPSGTDAHGLAPRPE